MFCGVRTTAVAVHPVNLHVELLEYKQLIKRHFSHPKLCHPFFLCTVALRLLQYSVASSNVPSMLASMSRRNIVSHTTLWQPEALQDIDNVIKRIVIIIYI